MTSHDERKAKAQAVLQGLDEHVEAIHSALRERLARQAGGPEAPVGLQVTLSVSSQSSDEQNGEEPSPTARAADCWKMQWCCGHGPNGYIMCETLVCEILEAPILP